MALSGQNSSLTFGSAPLGYSWESLPKLDSMQNRFLCFYICFGFVYSLHFAPVPLVN